MANTEGFICPKEHLYGLDIPMELVLATEAMNFIQIIEWHGQLLDILSKKTNCNETQIQNLRHWGMLLMAAVDT